MEAVEAQISTIKKQLLELRKLIEEGNVKDPLVGGSIDESFANGLESDFKKLKAELQKMKEEYGANFKNINEALNRKADKDELADLEARLLEKLNEMIKKLLG
jgi:signal recognition particle GTPase